MTEILKFSRNLWNSKAKSRGKNFCSGFCLALCVEVMEKKANAVKESARSNGITSSVEVQPNAYLEALVQMTDSSNLLPVTPPNSSAIFSCIGWFPLRYLNSVI